VLVVPGPVSVPWLSPGPGSVVRVVVVVPGVVVGRLVRVVRVVPDHHVLPSHWARGPPGTGRRLPTHLRAQLRSVAGGGNPRGVRGLHRDHIGRAPGRQRDRVVGSGDQRGARGLHRDRVVGAAEDDHRVTLAGRPDPPAGGPVLGSAAQEAEDLPVVPPAQPAPQRVGARILWSASRIQEAPEEADVRQRQQQSGGGELLHAGGPVH